MKIRPNDTVFIRTGKDKGQSGTVTKILKKQNKVVVEGVNKTKKNVKGRDGQPGEQIEFFAPIHISNVALIDPKTNKPTRIQYKREGKEKLRISVRSGEIITGKAKITKKKSETKNIKA